MKFVLSMDKEHKASEREMRKKVSVGLLEGLAVVEKPREIGVNNGQRVDERLLSDAQASQPVVRVFEQTQAHAVTE